MVDTCILTTASDACELGSLSDSCWLFLELLIQSIHKAVLSKDLEKQWNESITYTTKGGVTKHLIHASTWRNRLISTKTLELLPNKTRDYYLRARIKSLNKYPSMRSKTEKMLKDVLLIELALLIDRIIVSVNWKDRKKFCEATAYIRKLKPIVWVDAHKHRPYIKSWLASGANPVDEWKLGYQAP